VCIVVFTVSVTRRGRGGVRREVKGRGGSDGGCGVGIGNGNRLVIVVVVVAVLAVVDIVIDDR
jgi:hypothetical protein